jgi:DNA-binding response OmpR family regulator
VRELEARLRSMVRRQRGEIARETYTVGDLTIDLATLQVKRAGRTLTLTPIGFRLLAALARASPRVVTRRDLEREVWGEVPPDSDALRSHLYNLRKTIDRPFDRPLLHTIAATGYRLADDAGG